MKLLFRIFTRGKINPSGQKGQAQDGNNGDNRDSYAPQPLMADQHEQLVQNRMILDEQSTVQGDRLHREVDREVRSAAELSLKRLHVIQRGRCPQCGDSLRQHLFAAICDGCGWHTFDSPRQGSVAVHLNTNAPPVEGERCYTVKTGAVLVLRNDVVIARVPSGAVAWVEYKWSDRELENRKRSLAERMSLDCGWCNTPTRPDLEGFHLVQTAFGATQERYCFCCDDCYEAFRKMYPSRVDRNCYETPCAQCDKCTKRYEDETEGIRTLAKDLLSPVRRI